MGTTVVTSPMGAATGPEIKWDYSMDDNIGATYSGKVGPAATTQPKDTGNEQDLTGAFVPKEEMQPDPDYPAAGNALYGSVSPDGKYRVHLNACATKTTGDATFEWVIEGKTYTSSSCRITREIKEGKRDYTLKVTDSTGSSQVGGVFEVKNVLLAIMGDSYSSGEGYPPFYTDDPVLKKRVPDWDDVACHRSRWSGFVRAAAQLEALDPRSNVTVINVACSGAQIYGNGGLLQPQQTSDAAGGYAVPKAFVPPQVDQLEKLRKGQDIDVALLSIGGNDIGFSTIVANCLILNGPDDTCFTTQTPVPGQPGVQKPLWEVIDGLLAQLEQKWPDLDACLTAGNCRTIKAENAGKTKSNPLDIAPGKIIQAAYPNLVTDGAGDFCNTGGTGFFPFPKAPLKHSDSQWGSDVAIKGEAGKDYQITVWKGNPPVATNPAQVVDVKTTAPGLGRQLLGNVSRYGWTEVPDVFFRNGGMCADDATRLIFQATESDSQYLQKTNTSGVVHPNNKGQEAYREALIPAATKEARLPVPAPTQKDVTNPGPTTPTTPTTPPTAGPGAPTTTPQLNPPTSLKVKTKGCKAKRCTVKISFKAPTTGAKPDAYKIQTKLGKSAWTTLKDRTAKTKATLKKVGKGKKVSVRVASLSDGPTGSGVSTLYSSKYTSKKSKVGSRK